VTTVGDQEQSPIEQVTGKVADLGRDIGEYIKQQRSSAKISLRQLSKLAGVSNPYLSQIERGLRKPSAEILQQIAKGLRISAEALYVQAGILDVPHGGPVVDAVRADDALTERQKQILLDVYESFRRENSTQSTVEGSDVDGAEESNGPRI
jgi:transcriptional regulator with XRE-family HTH domain